MRSAQTVTAFTSQKVRYHRADASAVVDDPVVALLKYALLRAEGVFAPLRMHKQMRVLSIAGYRVGGPMQPVQLTPNPYARLVKVTDLSLNELGLNLFLNGV